MGRFSDNGLKKEKGSAAAAKDSKVDSKLKDQKTNNLALEETNKPENQYTEAQMKPVNVGGFRVPMVVRAHWQSSAKLQGDKVATILRAFLVERYGLPEGITEDDLLC
ncbi:MAG: hypothetical protein AAF716_21380 [Cyanobacteria bacterium P01_D01_bin.1]